MDWHSYEELVKDIYQQLGKSGGLHIDCWGSSCKVQGKSGTSHQIDVLTSHSDGIHTYKTAIECKYWNKKVSKDAVTKLLRILDDSNIEKGVLVSTLGFTKDAEKLAKFYNISLVRLREQIDSDWEGFIREVTLELNYILDEIFDYNAVCSNVDGSHQNTFLNLGHELRVEVENRNAMSFYEIAEIVRKSPEDKSSDIDEYGFRWSVISSANDLIKCYVVRFRDGTGLAHPATGATGNIIELRFKKRVTVITRLVHVDIKDYVSWIMEVIFEGKRFAISPDRIPTTW